MYQTSKGEERKRVFNFDADAYIAPAESYMTQFDRTLAQTRRTQPKLQPLRNLLHQGGLSASNCLVRRQRHLTIGVTHFAKERDSRQCGISLRS